MHLSEDKRTVRIHGLTKCAILPAVAVAALLAFHAPAFAAEHDHAKGAAPPGAHGDHGPPVSSDARDIPPPPPRHETSDKFSKDDEKERAPPPPPPCDASAGKECPPPPPHADHPPGAHPPHGEHPHPHSEHPVPPAEGEKAKE